MDSTFLQQRLDRLRECILDLDALQKQYQRELQLADADLAAAAHCKEQIKGLTRQLEVSSKEHEALTQQLASIAPDSLTLTASAQLLQIEQTIQRLQGEQTALLATQSATQPEHSAGQAADQQQPSPEKDLQVKLDALRERIKSLNKPIETDPPPQNQLDPQSPKLTPLQPLQNPEKRLAEPPPTDLPREEPPQAEPVPPVIADPLPSVSPPPASAENQPQPLDERSEKDQVEPQPDFALRDTPTVQPKDQVEPQPDFALRDTPTVQPGGVMNRQPEGTRQPSGYSKKKLLGVLACFVILPIGVQLARTALQQKADEKTCHQALTQTGDANQALAAAKSVLAACTALTSRDPNNVSAWKNAGRASLLTWSSEADTQTKKALIDQTREHFKQAVEKSGGQDPQAWFYWKFMDDFAEFTTKAQDKSKQNFQCDMPASERYKEALEIYNPPANASEKPYKISQSDEFILLELSHFLINRDVDAQNAINLLNSILKANPDADYKDRLLKNIWLSKAGAENRVNRYDQVRDSLLKALKYDPTSYKILQDLGGAYAQLAVSSSSQNKEQDRELAIKSYQKITQNSDTANSYRAWRNLSFLLYLQGKYPEAVQTFDKTLTFKIAVSEDDKENEGLIREYREASIACNAGGNCPQEKKNVLEKELRDRKLFSNYFITHDLIEMELTDPFFDVEHDLFYKCQK